MLYKFVIPLGMFAHIFMTPLTVPVCKLCSKSAPLLMGLTLSGDIKHNQLYPFLIEPPGVRSC